MQNPKQMNGRTQNNKHVHHLMRAPPNIKSSRTEPFWKSRAIHKCAEKKDSTLRVVVGETRLFVELLEREQPRCVDDGSECREARQDEDGKTEQAVLTALVGGMNDNENR